MAVAKGRTKYQAEMQSKFKSIRNCFGNFFLQNITLAILQLTENNIKT